MTRWRSLAFALGAGVVAIAGTCSLGVWQLHRAAAKEVLQRAIDEAAQAPAVTPDASALARPAGLVHRHLRLRGRWMPNEVVYLDNRPMSGRAGFYTLMVLRLETPEAQDIVVDRGWLARDANDRARIAPYRTPDGIVEIHGIALVEEPRLLELGPPGEPRLGAIWQNFDVDAFARVTGRAPLRFVVRQDADAANPDGLLREWPDHGGALQAQIDRHHGYAFQWFALAATLAALAGYRLFRLFRVSRHEQPVPA